jgi:hypothetical protein
MPFPPFAREMPQQKRPQLIQRSISAPPAASTRCAARPWPRVNATAHTHFHQHLHWSSTHLCEMPFFVCLSISAYVLSKPSGRKIGSHPNLDGPLAATIVPCVRPTNKCGSSSGPARRRKYSTTLTGCWTGMRTLIHCTTTSLSNYSGTRRGMGTGREPARAAIDQHSVSHLTARIRKYALSISALVLKPFQHLIEPLVTKLFQKPFDVRTCAHIQGLLTKACR